MALTSQIRTGQGPNRPAASLDSAPAGRREAAGLDFPDGGQIRPAAKSGRRLKSGRRPAAGGRRPAAKFRRPAALIFRPAAKFRRPAALIFRPAAPYLARSSIRLTTYLT
jgi:hypothetical protein